VLGFRLGEQVDFLLLSYLQSVECLLGDQQNNVLADIKLTVY